MSTPYVTGPCFIYTAVPTNLAGLIPIAIRQPNDTVLRPVKLAGLPGAGAGRLTSVPKDPPQAVNDFILVAFRTLTPLYVGTCEDSPVLDFHPAYIPIPVDEAGQTYGFDYLYDGQEADMTAVLNTYNEGVVAFMESYAAGGLLNFASPRGLDVDSVGTLMMMEGAALPLWFIFPYAGKGFFAAAAMPPCYRFFATRLTHNGLRNLSTKPKKVLLAWRAQRIVVPGVGGLLYDHLPGPGLPFPN